MKCSILFLKKVVIFNLELKGINNFFILINSIYFKIKYFCIHNEAFLWAYF